MELKNKFKVHLKDDEQQQKSLAKAFKALRRLDKTRSRSVKGGVECYRQWMGFHRFAQHAQSTDPGQGGQII